MNLVDRLAILLLIAVSVRAADFQNGQAARVVIGQTSFSARDTGIAVTALSISNNRLYAADATRHLLAFDLTKIPAAKDDLADRAGPACALCGFPPLAVLDQPVLKGIAAVSVFGKTVVIADPPGHRVLIWRDVSAPSASSSPDVVLGRSGNDSSVSPTALAEPISVAFDGKRLFVGDGELHRVLIWNSLPSADNQPADAVLGQPNFTAENTTDTPGPDTIGRPAALASDGTNLYVADALYRRILVFTSADAALSAKAVLNSASLFPGPLAPGTLVTIDAAGLSETTEEAPDDGVQSLPKKLAGVEVLVDGVALPLLSVSPTQIRAQIPYDLGNAAAASLYVRSERGDGAVTITNAVTVKLLAATPGLFAFGGVEPRSGLTVHMDTASQGQPGTPVTVENPAKPGEVLVFWAAGLGVVDDVGGKTLVAGLPYDGSDAPVLNPVTAIVNGREAQILSAALPHQAIGVYEVRILLPDDLPADPKTPLLIEQDGFTSNTVTIPVGSAVH